MDSINHLIKLAAQYNFSQKIYDLNMLLSCVIVFVFMYSYRKKYDISVKHFLITMLVLYPVGYLWMLVYTWMDGGFQKWGGGNIVRIFVYYPIFLYPVSKFTKIKLGKLLDYIAPGLALLQGFDHVTCIFPGCCYGYPASWGVWNKKVDDYLFPNQWVEALVSLVIFVYLMRKAERCNFEGDGRFFADFLIIFGGTRFFLEFLRNNDKLVFGISNLAFHAAFMVVVGIFMYIRINRKK